MVDLFILYNMIQKIQQLYQISQTLWLVNKYYILWLLFIDIKMVVYAN